MSDLLSDYDYLLPEELIAQAPAPAREGARLLVLGREAPAHRRVSELPALLPSLLGEGALLVVNDTRVIPARLFARKMREGPAGREGTGGAVELLLCDPLGAPATPAGTFSERWRCLYRASKPLRPGTALQLLVGGSHPSASAEAGDAASSPAAPEVLIEENEGNGRVVVRFSGRLERDGGGLLAVLDRFGQVPLPPYIRRAAGEGDRGGPTDADRSRYQTVFARVPGAVAAPTAGLHFSEELLGALHARGLRRAAVTLHVGPGTFAPVKDDDLTRHVMHGERFDIPEETAAAIAAARRDGRKVLAVGTTVVRALESATPEGEAAPRPGPGQSTLFIRPPYRFRSVDALLTNFHLPRSTLLMLVSALAGRRRVLAAYGEAVRERYRFFSYGDAMLIPAAMEDHAPC